MDPVEKFSERLKPFFCSSFGLLLFLFSLLYVLLTFSLEADYDLFARMAVGKLISQFGSVPLTDPFAYTRTKAVWVDHEWLSGLVFYDLFTLFGDYALLWFSVAIATLTTFVLIELQPKSRVGQFRILLFVLCLLQLVYLWQSVVRSQVFTYLFLAYYLYAFIEFRNTKRRFPMLLAALIMPVWANAHGGFVVGLGFFGIFSFAYAISSKDSRYFPTATFVIALFSTLLNPYGIQYWHYILEATTMARPSISEWAPLSFAQTDTYLFLFFSLWGAFICLTKKEQIHLETYLFVIFSVFYGFKHSRLTAIYILVFLAYLLPLVSFDRFKKLNVLSVVMCGGVFAYSLIYLCADLLKQERTLSYSNFPVAAFDWLSTLSLKQQRLLVDFNMGSYALWCLYPDFKISLDGRYEEVYPESTVHNVSKAFAINDAQHQDYLELVKPNFILIHSWHPAYLNPESFGKNWRSVYKDKKFMILGEDLTSLP